jgi:hypothetical protein
MALEKIRRLRNCANGTLLYSDPMMLMSFEITSLVVQPESYREGVPCVHNTNGSSL